jgi:hypothetical protein
VTFAGLEYWRWAQRLRAARNNPEQERHVLAELDRVWSALTDRERAQIEVKS